MAEERLDGWMDWWVALLDYQLGDLDANTYIFLPVGSAIHTSYLWAGKERFGSFREAVSSRDIRCYSGRHLLSP